MRTLIILILLFAVSIPNVWADSPTNKKYSILSPDGQKQIFIKKSKKEIIPAVGDIADYSPEARLADELWISDLDGGNAELLVDTVKSQYGEQKKESLPLNLCGKPKYSPDGKQLYFRATMWATSCALYSIDIETSEHKYISPANSLRVIQKGDHLGDLIIEKHKYFEVGRMGSYDWLWLVSADGKEIGPLGPEHELDWEQMVQFYGIKE